MKRVIIFDLENCTLEDIENMESELAKKKKLLQKEEEEDDPYEQFIDKAKEFYKDEGHGDWEYEYALSESYKLIKEPWIKTECSLEFGDSPPCVVDDCWCQGNLDRVKGMQFYHNILREDYIICEVCLSNDRGTEFGEFILEDWMITHLKNEIKV